VFTIEATDVSRRVRKKRGGWHSDIAAEEITAERERERERKREGEQGAAAAAQHSDENNEMLPQRRGKYARDAAADACTLDCV